MADDIADNRKFQALDSISVSTKEALVLNETAEKSSRALEIMYVSPPP